MSWTVFLRRGLVIVASAAKTRAGFYMDVEPVRVAESNDLESIGRAVKFVIDRGEVIVDTPTRASMPPAVVLKYAGVKTWSSFANGMSNWHIRRRDLRFVIEIPVNAASAAERSNRTSKEEMLPIGATSEDVGRRIAQSIQDYLSKPSDSERDSAT